MPLQIRRGTEAERLVLATAPVEGELIWITDDQKLYIGDGATLAKNLTPVTGYNDSDAVDATAAALLAGTHTNIAFTYAGGAINAEVEFTDFDGVVKAAAFNGSVVADDSTELVNAVDGTFNLDGTIKGHIVPDADEAYDIGSASYKFKDLYLSGSSIKLGNAEITSSGNAIVLPEGSFILGGYNSSIVADDSSVIVNTATKAITGTFTGDLTGSVFGDDSSVLVDAVDNTLSGTRVTTTNLDFTADIGDGFITVNPGSYLNIGFTDSTANPVIHRYNPDPGIIERIYGIADGNSAPESSVNISRGTLNTPASVQTGDLLFAQYISGYESTSADFIPSTAIVHYSDSNVAVAAGQVPGGIALVTIPDGDPDNTSNAFTVDSTGAVSINRDLTQARATLDIGGAMALEVLTAAPSTPVDGMIAIADGATWDPSGGNPTKKQMVVWFGAWVQIAIQP